MNSRYDRRHFFILVFPVCLGLSVAGALGDEPIAEIAVIANPYITTLPPEQIKDESGRVRDFLAKTAPASMEKTVALVNHIKPDALVVLGSLTWAVPV